MQSQRSHEHKLPFTEVKVGLNSLHAFPTHLDSRESTAELEKMDLDDLHSV